MAQLKSSTVTDSVSVTAEILADGVQISKIYVLTSSGDTTYGGRNKLNA